MTLDLSKIGGSDIAAIVGLSPWAGPWDVWARIVEGVRGPESEAMAWGTTLEPVVAAEWMRRHDDAARWERGVSATPPDRPWLRVTPDYVDTAAGRILEVKTTSANGYRYGWGEPGSSVVPDHYDCQIQTYMAQLGATVCHVAVLVGGQALHAYTVLADAEVGATLLAAGEAFWRDHIEPAIPPPPDSSRACRDALSRRYPGTESRAVRPATGHELAIADRLRRAKKEALALRDLEVELGNELRLSMRDDYGIDCGDIGRVLLTQVREGRRTDWRRVAAALMQAAGAAGVNVDAVVADHTTTSAARRDLRTYFAGLNDGGDE